MKVHSHTRRTEVTEAVLTEGEIKVAITEFAARLDARASALLPDSGPVKIEVDRDQDGALCAKLTYERRID